MKFLSEKTVLKFLGLPKIESSIVISDPFKKDCPMVFISKEFSKHTGYSIKEAIGKKIAGFYKDLKLMIMMFSKLN